MTKDIVTLNIVDEFIENGNQGFYCMHFMGFNAKSHYICQWHTDATIPIMDSKNIDLIKFIENK